MPHDFIDDPMYAAYRVTADKLSKGEQVSEDEMRKFLGTTGLLQMKTLERLWTQEELQGEIDKRVSDRCSKCEGKAQRVPSTLWALVCTNFRLIFICVTVMVSLAIAFNQLPALKDFFRSAKTEAVALSHGGSK